MNNKAQAFKGNNPILLTGISCLFGATFLAIGFINTFWGNDPGFGIFVVLLSLLYFPPIETAIKKQFRFSIPAVAKVGLGIFIIWAALGVGELFDKISLMMETF